MWFFLYKLANASNIPLLSFSDDSNQPPLADNLATPSTVGNNTEVQGKVEIISLALKIITKHWIKMC